MFVNDLVRRMSLIAVTLLLAAASQPQPVIAQSAIEIHPGDDVTALLEGQAPGTAYLFRAGVHRPPPIEPRDGDRFVGEPGAVLSGARPVDRFERVGEVWIADLGLRERADEHGRCAPMLGDDAYEGCRFSNDLYLDGVVLVQVTERSKVEPGHWWMSPDGHAIIADDPAGRAVDVSVTEVAFFGSGQDVTIRGFTIEMYASGAQSGAIQGDTGSGWVIENNEVRLNHGMAIRIGDAMTVRDNHIHHNGQMGLGGIGDGVRVLDNEVSHNNTLGFSPSWEAGGAKFVLTNGLLVQGNHFHHNRGTGIWTDIDNVGAVIADNLVEWNEREGIQHEISYDAAIRDNTVRFNGRGRDTWLWGAQILIQNSSGVDVFRNRVTVSADGGDGIGVINQRRDAGSLGETVARNIHVFDNDVTFLGPVGQSGIADDTGTGFACGADAGNSFEGNRYFVQGDWKHWEHCGRATWESFRDAGHERTGTLTLASTSSDSVPLTLLVGTVLAAILFLSLLTLGTRRWGHRQRGTARSTDASVE